MAAKKSNSKKAQPASRKVRSLRHWKQRFNPTAAFVLRRATSWDGHDLAAGDLMPEEMIVALGRTKLRRWWEAKRIELAEFEAPETAYGLPYMGASEPEVHEGGTVLEASSNEDHLDDSSDAQGEE